MKKVLDGLKQIKFCVKAEIIFSCVFVTIESMGRFNFTRNPFLKILQEEPKTPDRERIMSGSKNDMKHTLHPPLQMLLTSERYDGGSLWYLTYQAPPKFKVWVPPILVK